MDAAAAKDDLKNFLTKDDLQEALDTVVAKMISKMGGIGNKVDNEVSALKLEQGRLSSSLNNIQTQVLDSKGRFSADASPNSGGNWPPHKFRFSKYDGSEDPLGWLHKEEQFFLTQGTHEDQKVWTASFYMQGNAEQWYYRFQKNLGATPTWDQSHCKRGRGEVDWNSQSLQCEGEIHLHQPILLSIKPAI